MKFAYMDNAGCGEVAFYYDPPGGVFPDDGSVFGPGTLVNGEPMAGWEDIRYCRTCGATMTGQLIRRVNFEEIA